MAGFLHYGKSFFNRPYVARDGKTHAEIGRVEGDFYTISNSSWSELTQLCAKHGVPADSWPEYESCIDIPLEEVVQKNILLREQVALLSEEVVDSMFWLKEVVGRIKAGDIVVYSRL